MDDLSENRLREASQKFIAASQLGGTLASAKAPQYRAKVFKSGNSLALRLPKELGFKEGSVMTLQAHDGGWRIAPEAAPMRGIDVSGFAGKCPWLQPLPREDFEERPSTIAARKAAGLA